MKRQRQKLFRVFLAGVLMLFSFMAYAQERTVTGRVYDSSGESIIGASVVVQGTMQGVVTDMDGAFQLKVQPSQSLVISFLGYKDVILPVGNKNDFKIILEEDSKKLDEVVVVGYATQKKVNLTGSVASVSAKDIQDIPVGFAQCGLRHDYVEGTDSSPVGYLEGIFVKEEYRKQGYAKELMSACEQWAKKQGCVEFASDCELSNTDSFAFHMSMGFEEANRVICFTKKLL